MLGSLAMRLRWLSEDGENIANGMGADVLGLNHIEVLGFGVAIAHDVFEVR